MTPTNPAAAIEIHGLEKRFGSAAALDGLDLVVRPGEIHGFLGPNGAGKSTTIRILLGLMRSSAGSVRLLGGDPWRDATELHRRLAYVPGDVTLWPGLTGGETIDLLGRLRGRGTGPRSGGAAGGGDDLDRRRRDELIERFQLDPRKRSRTYSKGNRQKVAIIAALASRAELLILDEPTSGLDPLMEAVFQQAIVEEREQGRTVLLSSHILSEVETLCDRVSIIRAGRTVETGTLADLRHLSRTVVRAQFSGRPPTPDDLDRVHGLRVAAGSVQFEVDTEALPRTLAALSRIDGLSGIDARPPTLESLFLSHYDTRSGAKAGSAA